HEIARLRLIEVVEILPKPKFVKKTGCARSVCVPSAPDTFAVALISNDQSLQRGIIQVQLAVRTQSLDRSDKNQICCAGAKPGRGLRSQNEKFADSELCGELKRNLCKVRNGIAPACGNLLDL